VRWTDTVRLVPVMVSLVLGACAWLPSPEEQPPLASDSEQQIAQERARLETLFGQALTAMEEGADNQARELLEEIHGQRPEATGVLLNLGILAEREGDKALARQWFERVLAVDSGHVRALNRLAMLDREQGAFELARSRYLKALERKPDDAPVLLNLAILLDIYLGLPGEALTYYQRYGEAAPEPDPRLEDWVFDARQRSGTTTGGSL
jgi:lipoprotein NlpI